MSLGWMVSIFLISHLVVKVGSKDITICKLRLNMLYHISISLDVPKVCDDPCALMTFSSLRLLRVYSCLKNLHVFAAGDLN